MAENKKSLGSEITKGIIKENPTLVMLLGMCPTLAVTTQAKNGIGMGLATMFVLLGRRLKKRGTESDEVIEERISKAAGEIMLAEKYDYVVVNAALEDVVSDFLTIIRAEELKSEFSGEIINEVLKNA